MDLFIFISLFSRSKWDWSRYRIEHETTDESNENEMISRADFAVLLQYHLSFNPNTPINEVKLWTLLIF